MKKTIVITLVVILGLIALIPLLNQEDDVVIGFSTALTGPVQIPGNWALEGAELAAQDLNVKLMVEDDQCKPSEAATTTNKLVNIDGVSKMLIFCTSAAPGTTMITKDKSLVLLSSVKSIHEPNYFSIYPSIKLEMEKLAEHIRNKGITKVAQFYQADAAGEAIKINFVNAFGSLGGNVVIVEGSSNFEDKDFRTSLLKAKEKNVEAVMITGAPGNFIKAVQQIEELGLDVQIFSTSLGAETPAIGKLGKLAEGIEFSAPYVGNNEFVEKYKEKYGTKPSVWAAFAYDGVKILVQLEKLCRDNLDCMQKEILKIRDFEGASGRFSFNSEGTTDRNIYIKRVEDGSFKVIHTY